MTTELHPCPKCATPMRTIERSGIHLETCPDCRGIFLDRGELDRLLDLEAATLARREPAVGQPTAPGFAPVPAIPPLPAGGYASPATRGGEVAWPQPPPDWDRGRRRDRDDDDDDDDHRFDPRGWDRDARDGGGRRRRGGFLGELLEGLGD